MVFTCSVSHLVCNLLSFDVLGEQIAGITGDFVICKCSLFWLCIFIISDWVYLMSSLQIECSLVGADLHMQSVDVWYWCAILSGLCAQYCIWQFPKYNQWGTTVYSFQTISLFYFESSGASSVVRVTHRRKQAGLVMISKWPESDQLTSVLGQNQSSEASSLVLVHVAKWRMFFLGAHLTVLTLFGLGTKCMHVHQNMKGLITKLDQACVQNTFGWGKENFVGG